MYNKILIKCQYNIFFTEKESSVMISKKGGLVKKLEKYNIHNMIYYNIKAM